MEFETFNKTQNEYSKKLKEYFSWLNEKVFLISMMTYDNEETYNLIHNPKTVEEINAAKGFIQIFEDAYYIVTNEDEDYVVTPIEENEAIKLYIQLIKRFKDNKPYMDIIEEINNPKKMNTKKAAKVLFDIYQVTNYFDEIEDYIGKECGFDMEDFDEIEKLENYYKKAYSTLNSKINYDKNAVPDKYQKMIEITDEFHRLYLESKKVKQLSKEK